MNREANVDGAVPDATVGMHEFAVRRDALSQRQTHRELSSRRGFVIAHGTAGACDLTERGEDLSDVHGGMIGIDHGPAKGCSAFNGNSDIPEANHNYFQKST